MERLAIHGGPPIRQHELPVTYAGGQSIGEEEKQAVLEVLESQSLNRYLGPRLLNKVAAFESDFAAKVGAKYALAVCSGTAALHTAMSAIGLTYGDEVLLPGFYYVATAHAILATGALPVFVEVDDSLSFDPHDLENRITENTKAIVPVHMRGIPNNMDQIMAVAAKHGLAVIEDCAQSCGATFHGKHIGTFGIAGAFSLQYQKVLTTGDGGIVVTNDPLIYERAVRFHNNGNFPGGDPKEAVIGLNLRMTEISGAIAGVQLKRLDQLTAVTKHHKQRLVQLLRNVTKKYPITLQRIHDPAGDIGISLIMFVPEGKGQIFSEALHAEGITNWWLHNSAGHSYHTSYQILNQRTLNPKQYPFRHPANRKIEYSQDALPQTRSLLDRAIHFDITPFMTDEDLEMIAEGVEKVAYWLL